MQSRGQARQKEPPPLPCGQQHVDTSSSFQDVNQDVRQADMLSRDDLVLSEVIQDQVQAFARRYIRLAQLRGNAALERADLVQSANEMMLQYYPQALGKRNVVSYLLQVAKLTMIQCVAGKTPSERSMRIALARLDAPLPGEGGITLADTLAVEIRLDAPGTEHRAETIAQAVQALPEMRRTVIERHYGIGEHAPEGLNKISRSLARNPNAGCHVSTAYHHHKRALAALRVSLSSAFPEYCDCVGGVQ